MPFVGSVLKFCFYELGAGVCDEVVKGQLIALLADVEKDIQQWVKAAVESTVDEFMKKLKEATQEVEQPLSSRDVICTAVCPVPLVGSVAGRHTGIPRLGRSGSSVVPSEFGKRGVLPSGLESSGVVPTAKPGEKSQKIM